jgi:hypothetical protein
MTVEFGGASAVAEYGPICGSGPGAFAKGEVSFLREALQRIGLAIDLDDCVLSPDVVRLVPPFGTESILAERLVSNVILSPCTR